MFQRLNQWVLVLSLATLSGCWIEEDAPCAADTHCEDGRVFEMELCLRACSTDEDCEDDDTCVERRDGDGPVCLWPPAVVPNNATIDAGLRDSD